MNNVTKHRPENEKQRAACDYYSELGYKRSYRAVAEKFGVSLRTVKNWARIHGWRERIDQADEKAITEIRMSIASDGTDDIERLLKVARLVKVRALKRLSTTKQKPTFRELVALMNARLELYKLQIELTRSGKDGHLDNVIIVDCDE